MSNKLQFKTEVVLIFKKPLLWNAINKSVLYFAKKTLDFTKYSLNWVQYYANCPYILQNTPYFTKYSGTVNCYSALWLWSTEFRKAIFEMPAPSDVWFNFFFLQSIRRNKMSGPSMDFRKAVEMSGCQLGIKRRERLTAISVSIWKSFEFLTKWFHTCLRTMQK